MPEEQPSVQPLPLDDHPHAQNAVDAVRYLYLARVAEREGHHAAASRLHAAAAKWLDSNLPSSGQQ